LKVDEEGKVREENEGVKDEGARKWNEGKI